MRKKRNLWKKEKKKKKIASFFLEKRKKLETKSIFRIKSCLSGVLILKFPNFPIKFIKTESFFPITPEINFFFFLKKN